MFSTSQILSFPAWRDESQSRVIQTRHGAVDVLQPTQQTPSESLSNCVLIINQSATPPVPATWTRGASPSGVCARCLLHLTALSLIISPWHNLSSHKAVDVAS